MTNDNRDWVDKFFDSIGVVGVLLLAIFLTPFAIVCYLFSIVIVTAPFWIPICIIGSMIALVVSMLM